MKVLQLTILLIIEDYKEKFFFKMPNSLGHYMVRIFRVYAGVSWQQASGNKISEALTSCKPLNFGELY